jgi:imidazolonepropionase-like amidohydrolase
MEPYVRRQKPVLLRVRNAATIRAAVDFAKRNRLTVILGGATDAWKEADLLARERIPVIIEPAGRVALGANSPTADWDPYDAPYAAAGILARAGVVFAFESADNSASMNLANRAGQSCAYGLKPEDAIRALTLNAARIFGQDKLRGSIEAGKVADLIVVDGDPLEMASQVQMAFIAGLPVELTSKFTVLRDKYSVRR